jgi:RHS repeat-associated protein
VDENGTQTWTLYDRTTGNPITDFSSSDALETRYLSGGLSGILARETSGWTVSWYLADALGSVTDLINDSGSVVDHIDYSAFGNVLDQSSPTAADRFVGFAGMEQDSVTGLNLAVFRQENPGTGRWDSQDPLGFAAGDADLYEYVGNHPAGSSDSLGLIDWSKWPTWLPRTTPVETIKELLKSELDARKLRDLRRAKKLLEQARRLAEKGCGRLPRGGGRAGIYLIDPFTPVPIEMYPTWMQPTIRKMPGYRNLR